MQEVMGVMRFYGLGLSPSPKPRPSPHYAAQQLLGSLLGRGKINAFCAWTVAHFMFSDERLVVLSRDALQTINCDGGTLKTSASTANPFSGELAAVTDSSRGAVIASTVALHYLSDLPEHPDEAEPNGLTHGILCVTSCPDGAYIATGARNAVVTIWSGNLDVVHALSGHTDWVRFVKFAKGPSSELQLFSTGDDGVIFLWDPVEGARLSRLEYTGGSGVQVFEVSYLSGLMAIAYSSPLLALYRCHSSKATHAQGDEVLRLQQVSLITGAHRSTPTAAKFTEDAQWVASAGEDEILALSSVAEPRRIFVCSEFVTKRHCMSFMNTFNCICILSAPPTSSTIVIAVCASDGTVVQWVVDPRNDRSSYTKALQVHLGTLLSMDVIHVGRP